jgi:hypothetical protein
MITDEHLVMESLCVIDPDEPGLVLSSLPDEILGRIRQCANEYLRARMVTNYGVLPTPDQIRSAGHWIEKLLQQKASQGA